MNQKLLPGCGTAITLLFRWLQKRIKSLWFISFLGMVHTPFVAVSQHSNVSSGKEIHESRVLRNPFCSPATPLWITPSLRSGMLWGKRRETLMTYAFGLSQNMYSTAEEQLQWNAEVRKDWIFYKLNFTDNEIKAGFYTFISGALRYTRHITSSLHLNAELMSGMFYGGRGTSFTLGSEVTLSKHLTLRADYEYIFLEIHSIDKAHILRTAADISLQPNLKLTVLTQHNTFSHDTGTNLYLTYNLYGGHSITLAFHDWRNAVYHKLETFHVNNINGWVVKYTFKVKA